MQKIRFMFKMFIREPLWFRVLILAMLLASIVFSSSAASGIDYADSYAKIAAAILFLTVGLKLRRNARLLVIFGLLTLLSLYLAWDGYRTFGQ
jgi:predicted Na+-dependent transporter